MTRELNNKLLSAVSALLFQMLLLPRAAHWIYSFVSHMSGGLIESSDVLRIVILVSLHVAVMLVYRNFFIALAEAFSAEIDKKMFIFAVTLGIASPIISLAFGLFFSFVSLEAATISVLLSIFGYIMIWGTAIIHCILLAKSMSKVLSLRVRKWLKFSAAFKAMCLSLSIAHLFILFMAASGNEYMTTFINGFMDIPLHWLWLLWLFASPSLLVALDLFVYCAVLVYAFWNLSKRIDSRDSIICS